MILPAILALTTFASAGPVQLRTADGVTLSAEATGRGERGVLLVHRDGGDRGDWAQLTKRLAQSGFRVLALDLRGHGASGGGPLTEDAYPKMVADLEAGLAWLEQQGVEDPSIVGAELGANLAMHAASDDKVGTLALISPALSANGVRVSAGLARMGRTPVLLVASEGDTSSARAAQAIAGKATGPHKLALYPGSARGHTMLNTVPELETLLVSWLNGTYLQAEDPEAAQRADVKTGDVEDIETTGTRLEDR